MSNDVEEEGGKIDCQEVAQESSTKDNKDQDCGKFSFGYFCNVCAFHKILGELFWTQVLQNVGLEFIKRACYLKIITSLKQYARILPS